VFLSYIFELDYQSNVASGLRRLSIECRCEIENKILNHFYPLYPSSGSLKFADALESSANQGNPG
jgi:hypothetical protein